MLKFDHTITISPTFTAVPLNEVFRFWQQYFHDQLAFNVSEPHSFYADLFSAKEHSGVFLVRLQDWAGPSSDWYERMTHTESNARNFLDLLESLPLNHMVIFCPSTGEYAQ